MQKHLPFNTKRKRFEFPPILAINERLNGNIIQHLVQDSYSKEVVIEEYRENRATGYILTPTDNEQDTILAISNSAQAPELVSKVLRIQPIAQQNKAEILLEDSKAKWERHKNLSKILQPPINYEKRIDEIINSWKDTFIYLKEDQSRGIKGLRLPQIGSIHAVHAHWTISDQPATVVMPTGTGKTETMLSVLVTEQCRKLLVVVPTDALRTQIANKFLTLGILKDLGVVSESADYPIVGILKHRPRSVDDVDTFFRRCNVVVTTMSIAGQCSADVQKRMAHHCPYLFIDEAHHLGAKTWRMFKQQFALVRILQFTATPFREDNKPVEGKPIFNYPLKKAQEEGYFRPIQFKPVVEFDPEKRDQAIAEKAVEQLRADYKRGHILMARAGSIARAKEIYSIYQQYAEFNPVQIHTGLNITERKKIRKQILSGEARIVVCVDMLGEGFDLPELKIAAFHDIRKSLPVTLQLAGRFTRSRSDLGDPTFIANIAEVEVKEELRRLYAQDSDWNFLLRQASTEAIQEEFDLWEFIEGFQKFPEEISLQNVRPAMSTVIYKTKCENWNPDNFRAGIKAINEIDRVYHDLNPHKNTLVVVTAKKIPVDWVQMEEIYTWAWELYIINWDDKQRLLFIHGSSNSGFYKNLAEAVAGEDVEQIKGPSVFRCFFGVNRLKLQNVGLLEQLGRLIRYTMRAGSDVEPGLTEAQKRNAIKSNIFGAGFEDGRKTTVGCSYKGRIWSRRTTNIHALTRWCSVIGSKLLDDTIDPDEVLRGTLVPVLVSERPRKMPIGIEWPEEMYKESETTFQFVMGTGEPLPLHLTDIRLVDPTEDGELRFKIQSNESSVEFALNFFEKGSGTDFRFSEVSSKGVYIEYGLYQDLLTDFFYEYPPVIWFADGSSLEGNSYIELKKTYEPYPVEKIEAWDWTGIDIQKESQGISKAPDTIQHRVITELKKRSYDVIIDDDDSGEAADVAAIEILDAGVKVELYHCKYSQDEKPGRRIKDLYEVCGQAQKCIHWMEKPTELFYHFLRREPRQKKGETGSRFERGNKNDLLKISEMSRRVRIELDVHIVQPGLSKAKVSQAQLELLSVTENYLMETYKIPFGVIASP